MSRRSVNSATARSPISCAGTGVPTIASRASARRTSASSDCSIDTSLRSRASACVSVRHSRRSGLPRPSATQRATSASAAPGRRSRTRIAADPSSSGARSIRSPTSARRETTAAARPPLVGADTTIGRNNDSSSSTAIVSSSHEWTSSTRSARSPRSRSTATAIVAAGSSQSRSPSTMLIGRYGWARPNSMP